MGKMEFWFYHVREYYMVKKRNKFYYVQLIHVCPVLKLGCFISSQFQWHSFIILGTFCSVLKYMDMFFTHRIILK